MLGGPHLPQQLRGHVVTADTRRVPLDKREGSVKGKLVLGSAEAPLFRQRG
jgi:hypothetical protein